MLLHVWVCRVFLRENLQKHPAKSPLFTRDNYQVNLRQQLLLAAHHHHSCCYWYLLAGHTVHSCCTHSMLVLCALQACYCQHTQRSWPMHCSRGAEH